MNSINSNDTPELTTASRQPRSTYSVKGPNSCMAVVETFSPC